MTLKVKNIKRIPIMIFIAFLMFGLFVLNGENAYAATKSKIPNTSVYCDSKLVDAFKELGFKVKYDKKMEYAGIFSVSKHAIILKRKDKFNTLHEMGHFLSRLQEGADSTEEFKKIYKLEKKKYSARLKSYVTKSSKEYFAESFRQYCTWNSGLKKQRPKTYKYIDKMLKTISEEDVKNMHDAFSWAW